MLIKYQNISPLIKKYKKLFIHQLCREYTKIDAKYMTGGSGALLGFELKDGEDAGRKFIDNLKLLYHVANIGDARSLAIHPASTTHSQLSDDEKFLLE